METLKIVKDLFITVKDDLTTLNIDEEMNRFIVNENKKD